MFIAVPQLSIGMKVKYFEIFLFIFWLLYMLIEIERKYAIYIFRLTF